MKNRTPLLGRAAPEMFLYPPMGSLEGLLMRDLSLAFAFLVSAVLLSADACIARRSLAPQVQPSDLESCCALWPRSQRIALS